MWSTSTSTRTPGSTSAATASRARRTPSTRGSATPATSRTSAARTTIMALVEGRGRARGEVGMAALDLHKPVVELAQFSDSAAYGHTFAKLQLHEPRDILMPNTMCETQASKLFAALQEQQGELSIVSIPRKFFSEERGKSREQGGVKLICDRSSNDIFFCSHFLCQACSKSRS